MDFVVVVNTFFAAVAARRSAQNGSEQQRINRKTQTCSPGCRTRGRFGEQRAARKNNVADRSPSRMKKKKKKSSGAFDSDRPVVVGFYFQQFINIMCFVKTKTGLVIMKTRERFFPPADEIIDIRYLPESSFSFLFFERFTEYRFRIHLRIIQ